ncbi:MAG: hypothetical protein A2142_01750 [candidate division Zixibacteria bacterium RBG_16_48_11]|nr:MAG: hypothetical protein A2142_01750 [candidate division Zixibacteria bacterium RBG_16_48_11]
MQFRLYLALICLVVGEASFCQDLEEGIRLFDTGKTKEAYQIITKHLSQHPQDPLATLYLARLETRGENSLAYLEEALELVGRQKESDLAQVILAQYHYSTGHYATSAELLNRFKMEYPQSDFRPQALYLLGSSYLASEKSSLAQREFESILASFGKFDLAAWAQLGLGDCRYSSGYFSSAVVEYQKVLDKYEKSEAAPLALSQLSRCYTELKDPSKAHLYYSLLSDKYRVSAIFPEAPLGEAKSRPGAEKIVDVTYTVQLGVFGNQASVSQLISTLKSNGYQPRTTSKLVEKKRYTVVQVGSYSLLEDAKKAKEKLERELGGSYRVVIKE